MLLMLTVLLLIFFGSYGQKDTIHPTEETTRQVFVASLAAVVMGCLSPNPWLGVLMCLQGYAVWKTPVPRQEVQMNLYPNLMWMGLFIGLSHALTIEHVPVLLVGILSIGAYQGAYVLHSLVRGEDSYIAGYRFGRWALSFWEHGFYHQLTVGLGNPNHAQAVSAMTTAAGIGLLMMGYWLAWPFLCLAGLLLGYVLWRGDSYRHPTMVTGYVVVLGTGVLAYWSNEWWWTVGAGVSVMVFGAVWTYRPKWLSSRVTLWPWVWHQHCALPWKEKLLGVGMNGFVRLRMQRCPDEFKFDSKTEATIDPHNEWLAMLIENGWVGVIALTGYILTSFWTLVHAGSAGQAVLTVGAIVIACAFVSFPWHKVIDVGVVNRQTGTLDVRNNGCTALNLISLTIAVCVELIVK